MLAGVSWPSPRFTENADLTLSDALTGLIWSNNADPAGFPRKTWQEALDFIKDLNRQNYLGHNDWRLPNVNELGSLVNLEKSSVADWLVTQGFSNLVEDEYWTADTVTGNTAFAVSVNMHSGMMNSVVKDGSYPVWPVRSGQSGAAALPRTGQTSCWDGAGVARNCSGTGEDGEVQAGVAWPGVRFAANADQTITDNLTGLVWSKKAAPSTVGKPWQRALDYIKELNSQNYLGHNDWRLPNFAELRSLISYQQADQIGWLTKQGFTVEPNAYWMSDTSAVFPQYAYGYSIGSYSLIVYNKNAFEYLAWPVREGVLDGVCGSSGSGSFDIAPTVNLCAQGKASPVTGTGPWSWTCSGSSGGATVSCSARTQSGKPGDCDSDGMVTIAEVQSAINMFLGVNVVKECVNTDGDNAVSIAEVQKVINRFLGL